MKKHKTVFVTERGLRQQQRTLAAAPENLDIVMLREPDLATLTSQLMDAEYLISERVGVIDAETIAAAQDLKLIQRLGSLSFDIDTDAAKSAGIAVCYWPVASTIRVAEHVVLQMLALSKHLREAEAITLAASDEWGESKRTSEDTFAFNWSYRENVDGLWEKTIGIVGFGEIGAELARRLKNWGCNVLYFKRRQLPEHVELDLDIHYVGEMQLYRQSDFVVSLLPYFSETDMSLNENVFRSMKSGACLVSSGSGSVIDEQALATAVETGHLGGAALDTFEWEPIKPDHPLIALAQKNYNILLTPHIAAGSLRAANEQRASYFSNILRHLEGEPLKYRIV